MMVLSIVLCAICLPLLVFSVFIAARIAFKFNIEKADLTAPIGRDPIGAHYGPDKRKTVYIKNMKIFRAGIYVAAIVMLLFLFWVSFDPNCVIKFRDESNTPGALEGIASSVVLWCLVSGVVGALVGAIILVVVVNPIWAFLCDYWNKRLLKNTIYFREINFDLLFSEYDTSGWLAMSVGYLVGVLIVWLSAFGILQFI